MAFMNSATTIYEPLNITGTASIYTPGYDYEKIYSGSVATSTGSSTATASSYKWNTLPDLFGYKSLFGYSAPTIEHDEHNRMTHIKNINITTGDLSSYITSDSTDLSGYYVYPDGASIRFTDEFNYYTPTLESDLFGNNYAIGDKKELKRYKIKSNLIVLVPKRGNDIGKISDAEWIAMQTLREMISESDYRKYLKYGFISVTGSSGKIYQIFRENWHTKVFLNGVLVEEICVRITDKKIPPTDNVIAFKTIIETDEESFAAMGNVYRMVKKAA